MMRIIIFLLSSMITSSYVVNNPTIAELSNREETTNVIIADEASLHSALTTYHDRLFVVYVCRLKDNKPFYLFTTNYERVSELFIPYQSVVHLIITLDYYEEKSPIINDALTHIPDNSIFVLDGQPGLYDVCCLAQFRASLGFGPPVIVHTDQEIVWISPDLPAGWYPNQTQCYNSNMPLAYMNYKHVFRTNFYRPLVTDLPHVTFIPLGTAAARHTRLVAESIHTTSTISFTTADTRMVTPMVKPASERLKWCLFSGRLDYGYVTKYHSERGRLVDALLLLEATLREANMNTNSHSSENSSDSKNKWCILLQGDMNKYHHILDHDTYLSQLMEVAFTPCPPGNNPETFRHYEVSFE